MTTPQHLSDRYELGEILGFGGMSEVHLARDMRLHRDVAIKVLRADLARDPSFYLRFRREAQNAAALNHPAIVAVYDTGEAETADRAAALHRDGVRRRRHAARHRAHRRPDAAAAGDRGHRRRLPGAELQPPARHHPPRRQARQHHDQQGRRGEGDGLRHRPRARRRGNSVTQTAAVIGTAQYLSPEQARGETVDARSDVYSLGCVLYEILTGEPPFVGDSPVAVAYQHVREDPIPPSHRHAGISPELDAVVLKALAKNPDNRYQTAAEMRTDLIRVHSGEAPDAPKVLTDAERTSMLTAPPPRGRTRADRAHRRPTDARATSSATARGSVGRWLIAVAVLAVLTVVVTVAINMFGGEPRDVQVPDVTGQASADAIAALQNAGFETRTQQKPDSEVPPGHVIGTDPAADTAVAAGDEITINVSSGPEQREVPDVPRLHPRRGRAASSPTPASARFSRTPSASHAGAEGQGDGDQSAGELDLGDHQRDHHRGGFRAGQQAGPRREGQTRGLRGATSNASGFTNAIRSRWTAPRPPVEVLGTNPPAGQTVPVDTLIQLQVSQGNQFIDAGPARPVLGRRRAAPARARLDRAAGPGRRRAEQRSADQRGGRLRTRRRGPRVNFDGTITLSFAQ